MRPYLTLLRLPYQLQLGPIFAWGFLLAGGQWTSWPEAARFATVFLAFHVGAFGGLTALNSFYDRDTGPVGGLWTPPPPPRHLFVFAWAIQLGGLLIVFYLGWPLAVLYALILLLSLGYSHPRTRWKGSPAASLMVVATGQGILDFLAGALTLGSTFNPANWSLGAWSSVVGWGLAGATLTVCGFYPLTQLYQAADDAAKGDRTLALALLRWRGRAGVFAVAAALLMCGFACNALALWRARHPADALLLAVAALGVLLYLQIWRRDAATKAADFRHVHRFMRALALAFGGYISLRLLGGGL